MILILTQKLKMYSCHCLNNECYQHDTHFHGAPHFITETLTSEAGLWADWKKYDKAMYNCSNTIGGGIFKYTCMNMYY